MKKNILILFLLSVSCAFAQTQSYRFSKDIEHEILQDTLKHIGHRSQLGATALSISGYHKKAIQAWDLYFGRTKVLKASDSLTLKTYQTHPAKKYIIDQAKKSNITLINEAHHNAQHRAFATSLLTDLYQNGYRYIGIEALDNLANFTDNKFATTASGYYTNEPEFATFIRKALALGFTLFAYESAGNGPDREQGQAENIKKFMQNNTQGKYLLYVGYEHAFEGIHETWQKAMVQRLKELINEDVFTVDQVQFLEQSTPQFTHPYVAYFDPKEPVVLFDEFGKTVGVKRKEAYTDVSVMHPFTKYNHNKPNWLLGYGNKKWYKVPAKKLKHFPQLFLVYREGEARENGIPVEVVEAISTHDSVMFLLEPGRYEVVVKNAKNEEVSRFDIKM